MKMKLARLGTAFAFAMLGGTGVAYAAAVPDFPFGLPIAEWVRVLICQALKGMC